MTLSRNAKAMAQDLAARDGTSPEDAVRGAEHVQWFGQNAYAAMEETAQAMGIRDVAFANFMMQKAMSVLHDEVGAPATAIVQALCDRMRLVDEGRPQDDAFAAVKDRFLDAAVVAGAVVGSRTGVKQ